MKNKEHYIEVVNSFVSEYFPNSSGVMLTGSFVSEYFNEYSDLDVILLSKWHYKMFIESYEYEGLKIQIIVLPLTDAREILRKDAMCRNGALISMLNKGLILSDGDGFLERLKSEANILFREKRLAPKEIIEMERSKLTTVYEDICGLSDSDELVFAIADAMPKALTLYFLANGSWLYHGKSAARKLKDDCDPFMERFMSSFKTFFGRGDKSEVLDLLRGVLESAGGELHYYTTKSYKDIADHDDLVVYVSPLGDDRRLEALCQIEYAFHVFAMRRLPGLPYVSFVNSKDGLFNRGLYIVIKSPLKTINEVVLPLIHQFHFGNPVSGSSGLMGCWSYPHIFNPLLIRGLYSKPVYDFLCHVNNGKFNHHDKVKYALSVLLGASKHVAERHVADVRNVWSSVFDVFRSAHLNKMLPFECIEMVNGLKTRKIKDDYDVMLDRGVFADIADVANTFDFAEILEAIRVNQKEGGCEHYVSEADYMAYSLYKLTDVVMDVVGAGSADDKMLVSYSFSQQM